MQATRSFPTMALAPARRLRDKALAAPHSAADEVPLSALKRWTDRFCERLVAWGEGATHLRLGSWTRL